MPYFAFKKLISNLLPHFATSNLRLQPNIHFTVDNIPYKITVSKGQ